MFKRAQRPSIKPELQDFPAGSPAWVILHSYPKLHNGPSFLPTPPPLHDPAAFPFLSLFFFSFLFHNFLALSPPFFPVLSAYHNSTSALFLLTISLHVSSQRIHALQIPESFFSIQFMGVSPRTEILFDLQHRPIYICLLSK